MLKTYHNHNHMESVVDIDSPARLISYSTPIQSISLLAFLRSVPDAPRIYWENKQSRYAFAGYGVALTLTASGPQRFETIRQEAEKLFQNAQIAGGAEGIGPKLFGGFAFQPDFRPFGIWDAFESARFVLPRRLITRDNDQMWLTVSGLAFPGEENLLRQELSTVMQQLSRASLDVLAASNGHRAHADISYPLEKATWRNQIETATQRIRHGELEKVVLSRSSDATFGDPVDPVKILTNLEQRYANCYRFLFEPSAGSAFFGATPEILASVEGRKLVTGALAGSTKRGQSEAEDRHYADMLMANPKERHEHALVVNAMRERLEGITSTLSVSELPRIYRLSNIQHLHTPISGTLTHGSGILPVIERLHPTPAMGGFPQHTALNIITETEQVSRGWYASPVGWFDTQGDGIFAVAIRSAVAKDNHVRMFAGAGIVADSEPDREWDETALKFRPMLEALGVNGSVQ